MLVNLESEEKKKLLAFIPDLHYNLFNLEYNRPRAHVCGWPLCDLWTKGPVFFWKQKQTKQALFHPNGRCSHTTASCPLCLYNSQEHSAQFNRLFLTEGLGVQHPANFPISYGEKPFVLWNCISARQSPHRNSPHEKKAVLYLKP